MYEQFILDKTSSKAFMLNVHVCVLKSFLKLPATQLHIMYMYIKEVFLKFLQIAEVVLMADFC